MSVGLAAAAAAIFAPSGRWAGIDLGASGAAVFVITAAAAIWLFASRADQAFPEHMSLAERRAWVGMLFIAIILFTFLRQLWVLSGEPAVPQYLQGLFANRFLLRLAVLIVAWAVISHLVGRHQAGLEVDERDLRLRHRADRAGDWAFTLIVIAGICVLASVPAAKLGWWLSPIVLANLLIGLLIAKSLVEHVALTWLYRADRA